MLVPGPDKCFVGKDACLTFPHQVLSWSGQLFPQLWIAARHWKSFMKRDKTWRIGRSSKKWSAMNFRASAWSNRNLVTCRKICNSIPTFWRKIKESKKTEGIYFKQICRIEMLSQSRLKRRRKVSIKGQCRLSSRLSVSKKDGGPAAWCWVETGLLRGAHDRGRWMTWVAPPQEASHTFAYCSSFRTTACAAGFKVFWESQESQLLAPRWIIESD